MGNPAAPIASRWILDNKSTLASSILAEQYRTVTPLRERLSQRGQNASVKDIECQLEMLGAAVELEAPELFAGYAEWAKPLLSSRHVSEEDVIQNLHVAHKVLGERLPPEVREIPCAYVAVGIEAYRAAPQSIPSAITAVSPFSVLSQEYLSALLDGDRQQATRMILNAVQSGVSVREVYLGVFQTVQYEIGRLWQVNKISVAQEHFCTAATQLVMSQLYAHISSTIKYGKTIVSTSVRGELHELGIRMVADFFELEGWDSYYLGANSPSLSVAEALKERQAELLAISASMISHLHEVREIIQCVRADPGCAGVKILVGGHPFNSSPTLWKSVGADGHARDAAEAVQVVSSLLFQEVPQ